MTRVNPVRLLSSEIRYLSKILGAHRALIAAFLRMFYTEKIVVSSNVTLQLSKIDKSLHGILFKACKQLDKRGPYLSRMMLSRIEFRKYLRFFNR